MSKRITNKLSRRSAITSLMAFGVATSIGPGIAGQVYKEAHELKPGEFSWHPERAKSGPVAVIVSRADKQIMILENGKIVARGRAAIRDAHRPLGEHVFVLSRLHVGRRGLAWHAVGHHHSLTNGFHEPEESLIKCVNADRASIAALQKRMHPGMMLVMTDLPLDPSRRSGQDFVIVTPAES